MARYVITSTVVVDLPDGSVFDEGALMAPNPNYENLETRFEPRIVFRDCDDDLDDLEVPFETFHDFVV